ncbi:hypothetical protein RclHR1_06750008 [Rhizophagus clarus]|uniref:Uncharacterized protein n=1 Tax=Rhizophagus clarus TaxID=94130 RepID=A0A2Z6RU68_9GLOM|nr:hypothetical protein RclHR1_06750008 [Rhizophagus clarus]
MTALSTIFPPAQVPRLLSHALFKLHYCLHSFVWILHSDFMHAYFLCQDISPKQLHNYRRSSGLPLPIFQSSSTGSSSALPPLNPVIGFG